jgi:hypothetical protein
MTWVTLWWESCFFVAGLGMILKFGVDHRDRAWYRAQQVPWRLWLGRALLLIAYAVLYRLIILAYPYCVEFPKDASVEVQAKMVGEGLRRMHIALAVVIPFVALLWSRSRAGRSGSAGGSSTRPRCAGGLFGRRVWLGLGLMFHGFLILFMNIGMFPFIMLMTYAAWLTGEELAAALRWCVETVQRSPLGRALPARWFERMLTAPARRRPPRTCTPAADRSPTSSSCCSASASCTSLAPDRRRSRADHPRVLLGRPRARRRGHLRLWRSRPPGGAPALAYGPAAAPSHSRSCSRTRSPSASASGPTTTIFASWRGPARALFGAWPTVTGTSQSWKMFAPNPPRANVFMKTVVVTQSGERWNIGNNAYDYRPFPWVWNDRLRKMHRRMVSKGKATCATGPTSTAASGTWRPASAPRPSRSTS